MSFLRRRLPPRPSLTPLEPPPVQLDPARPWEVLSLVNEWVRHAEAKAGAILAAGGVVAGVLYSLLDKQTKPPWTLTLPAAICGIMTLSTAVMSAVALRPRLWAREAPTSLLYFDHIARRFDSPGAYGQALRGLVTSAEDELQQVAQQVWVNAVIARQKYQWAGRALVSLIGALAALGWTGAYLVMASMGVLRGQ